MEGLSSSKIKLNQQNAIVATKTDNAPKNIDKKNKISTSSAILGSLASVSVLGMADILLTKGKYITKLTGRGRGLEKEVSSLKEQLNGLNNRFAEANEEISKLVAKIEELSKRKIDSVLSRGEIDKELQGQIQKELENTELNYDVFKPYKVTRKARFKPEDYKENYVDIKTGTTNRCNMKELVIPEIKGDGSFDFELPKGCMKIKKAKMRDFETFKIQSNISEKYGDHVIWDEDKIARDILQNFFDGHGQTLDGVKIKFVPIENGKFRVRIEGKSTFDFKNAVIVGESESHEISQAAGNYGEGLKMISLKLLKQDKASKVKIGSGNWEVSCRLEKDTRLDAELMNYNIEPVKNYDGNFLEFETSNQKLMQSLRKSINRFYHSSNTHFKNPDFENELLGFKILPEGEKGALYISGQRFEYDGDYDGFKNAIVFIKEKIPHNIYDMSRDRGSINLSSWNKIAQWITENSTTEELKQILKSLEPAATDPYSPMGNLCNSVCNVLASKISLGEIGAIKFPDNYIATMSFASPDTILEFRQNGYKVLPTIYERLGMKSMANMVNNARQHVPLMPTEVEKKKIAILKRALNRLSDLTKEHFTPEELDAHIHIFNAKSTAENAIQRYDNTLAEAIIDNGVQKGFWLDRNYINNARFSDVLETALHELSHKVGGDGTEKFGYKLTSVNKDAIAQIVENSEIAEEFRVLSSIWAEL